MRTTGQLADISLDFKTQKGKIALLVDTKQVEKLELLEKLKDKKLDIEIKQHREKRSNDANAYFHLLINKLARYFNLSDEDMKIKMNLDYGTIARFDNGKIKGCKVPKQTDMKKIYRYSKWYKEDDEGNDCYIFYKETHTLNTKEMAQLINGVIQECQDVGIETKSQKEIENLLKEWDKK